MVTTYLLTDPGEINRIIPECIQLAKAEKAPLPFQYMHMPVAWWETFHSEQGAQFWQKRGKNFLGAQSKLGKFFILICRDGKDLCGLVPLVQWSIRTSTGKNEIKIISLPGDYVLHPFQDIVISHQKRQEVITELVEQITNLLQKNRSGFWAGYIPEDSPNLLAFRQACNFLPTKKMKCQEAISSQRGGVWPWTINGIKATLRDICTIQEKLGRDIEGLSELTRKFSECSPQSLLFPRTRNNLLEQLQNELPRIQSSEGLTELAEKLAAFLPNSPMWYPYIELPCTREEYLASLSYSTRRYFRRYMKKFQEAGGSFDTVLPHEITESDIDDYIRLHLLRWGNGSAAICGDAAAYHRKISRAMAQQEMFLLFFARYKNKRIAVHSCFDTGLRREGYITGVDPEYEELRAGRLLYLQTIYDAIDSGYSRYELGAVGFDYKMSFVKKSAVAHNFFLFPANVDLSWDQIFTGFECMEQIPE